ncbi:MAG: FKBP-type peptidyl-prolyl cis-trans isomerase [Agathobacter sp.]|nr:FKBP-type peptidyl-prolyl cis-trans isomerase [Agathobacter sp.]
MKKRLLAILLCAVMTVSVCACGQSDTKDTESVQNTENSGNSETQNTKQPSVEKLADYSDMSVVLSGEYEITEDALKAFFSNVLSDAGVGLMKVTDRDIVQAGDIVKADYTGRVNNLKFEGGSTIDSEGNSDPQWIDVSNNSGFDISTGSPSGGFIDGFTDGLIGAKIGEPTDGDVVFPETYDRDTTLEDGSTLNLANQPAVFQFIVHEIYEVVTPENITDAFVAENLSKNYEVNTVAEFMDYVEKELAYNYTINYLIANSTFDIPETYLDARLNDYQALFEEMYCQETDLETYLSTYGYTVKQMQAQWIEQLKNQIQAELIFAAMVEHDKMTIDEAGHDAYVQAVLKANGALFPDAESFYKYAGGGNAEAGEAYMKNQTTVREHFLANYDK